VTILLDITASQLRLGLSVIVDSVFMNADRLHAQHLAHEHQARFRPIYVSVSDDKVWEHRVTARYNEMKHKDVATWERIQYQRGHFRHWEPGTAIFVDTLHAAEQNYADVLRFVTNENILLQPLAEAPWAVGKYHA
jgi:predicted kinase